jgi:aspartate carbamoyltransferase catalytic subunit
MAEALIHFTNDTRTFRPVQKGGSIEETVGCHVPQPGPMNRGLEIASGVADGRQSLTRRQLRKGPHARMALLLTLSRARP